MKRNDPPLSAEQLATKREKTRLWQKNNWAKYRAQRIQARSAKCDVPCDITEQTLTTLFTQQEGRCYYSGLPMTVGGDPDTTISVDRVDPSGGYTEGNMVLCINAINMMKKLHTVEQFTKLCNAVAVHSLPT